MFPSDFPPVFVRVAAFLFGTLWGSFFNVCIYRWPREMSVVRPPSHCPACGASIPPYRNIPVFGYLFLRGRASCCGATLSPRYLLVEFVSGLLCLACLERWFLGAGPGREAGEALTEALLYFTFTGGLVIATFVDLEWMEIPDEVSLPGAALGLMTVAMRQAPGAEEAAVGAGLGFLVIQVLFVWGYESILGRRGMGEGDSKLMLFLGAFLGWQGAIFAIVAGAFQGLIGAGIALATGRSLTPVRPDARELDDDPVEGPDPSPDAESPSGDAPLRRSTPPGSEDDEAAELDDGRLKIPFGPFLALGALEFLFFGDRIVAWYAGFFVG